LDLAEAVALVASCKCGAVVTFSGNIRDTEKGDKIDAIRFEAYEPMALKELESLVATVKTRWDVDAVVWHRLGEVPAGESSLLIVCAGKHRPETFEANRWILEEIKSHVPIWKVGFEKGGATCC
jgi:molybdopterin synthase catalytic subunit